MPELKTIKDKPITLANVIDEVKPKKKADILPVQQKALDHSTRFNKLNKDKGVKLVKELKDLEIPRMTDEHIINIINLMPENVDELKTIFSGTKTTITAENLSKIQKLVKKYEK